MRKPVFAIPVITGIVFMTVFFVASQESEVLSARQVSHADMVSPDYNYKLQYSYNGKTWYDVITIENGELSKNVTYLKRGNTFPFLRYWYTYIDNYGERRAVSIPLTVESPPGNRSGRHV